MLKNLFYQRIAMYTMYCIELFIEEKECVRTYLLFVLDLISRKKNKKNREQIEPIMSL